MRFLRVLFTHGVALAIGFALGVYFLPILTAPSGPDEAVLAEAAERASFRAEFTRDLEGSDFLHWGEGEILISREMIAHRGALSPGPDFKLYLTNAFVEDEESFLAIKADAALIGDVKSFDGFALDVPNGVDPAAYTTAVVWCEAFEEFITAAQYR
ncbi:MAG: DM13 domain-containing protein [Pseudomonadota bacterium]